MLFTATASNECFSIHRRFYLRSVFSGLISAAENSMASLIGQTLQNRYLITAVLGKQRGRRTFLATDIATSTHRDFTAFSDSEMLEVQFSPQRLLNNQQFSLPKIKVPLQSNSTLYTVGIITLYSVITFLLFSVTLGLRIALIIAIIGFSLYAAHRAKKKTRKGIKTYQIAHLTIQELTADQLYLTLFIDTYQGKAKEHFEFCSTLPITAIATHQHSTAVKFQCLENKEERAVHIKGDRDDIHWFFNALNQWKQLAVTREQTNE
ncbi:MAG: hypothetical protein AB8B99_13570 [Phormidesmis sp.]